MGEPLGHGLSWLTLESAPCTPHMTFFRYDLSNMPLKGKITLSLQTGKTISNKTINY